MKISLVITTYNRANILKRAIDSVINQDFFEILVVDDCSLDNTESVVSSYPKIKYIRQDKNRGVNSARNLAIKNCNGDFVAFLDDDDQFVYNALDIMYKRISDLPENISVVYFNSIIRKNNNESFDGGFQFSKEQYFYDPNYFETMTKFNLKGDCKPVFRMSLFKDKKYSFPESVNGFESYLMNILARDGVGIRYFKDVSTIVNFTDEVVHISHSSPRKNPKPLLDLHIKQLQEHKSFYKENPHILSKKYIDIIKLSIRAKDFISLLIYITKYIILKFI